jgi:hypothetical protein
MPRHGLIYDIFLSSPGDVSAERNIVEKVVDELNRPLTNESAFALNLMRWETEALSGRGTDAQDVVNRTMFLRYDLYIGVLWSRFGTPTDRAGSGTEEEFNRALARYDEGDPSIELTFFYRKDKLPANVDPAELEKVLAFRRRLSSSARMLVIEYKNTRDFREQLYRHLRDYTAKALKARDRPLAGEILSKFRAIVTTLGRAQKDVAESLSQLANGHGTMTRGQTPGGVFNDAWRRLDVAEREVNTITVAITYDIRNLAADWILVPNNRAAVRAFAQLFVQEAKDIEQLMSALYFPHEALQELPGDMGSLLNRHGSLLDSCLSFFRRCKQQIREIVAVDPPNHY